MGLISVQADLAAPIPAWIYWLAAVVALAWVGEGILSIRRYRRLRSSRPHALRQLTIFLAAFCLAPVAGVALAVLAALQRAGQVSFAWVLAVDLLVIVSCVFWLAVVPGNRD